MEVAEGIAAVLVWLCLVSVVRALLMPDPALRSEQTLGQAALALLLTATAIVAQVLIVREIRRRGERPAVAAQ